MIELPDFKKVWEYENNFWLSAETDRLAKVLSHYELFKMVKDLPGVFIECGMFKGVSFKRFAMMRELLMQPGGRVMIGFDAFGKFPGSQYEDDIPRIEKFEKNVGSEGIDIIQFKEILNRFNLGDHVELVKGDVSVTVPEYVKKKPELRIALLNLDTDTYEPACTVLECLWPKIVPGGILVVDNYGVFPGETKAVDDFMARTGLIIKKFPFSYTPCFLIKERM